VKKYWKYAVLLLIIAVIIIAAIYRITSAAKTAEARRQPAPLVKVERPVRETVRIQLHVNGDVLPIRQAGIYSKVVGNLERIYADMGSDVRSNQLLATIDSTELYQQFQQTGATFQNAQMTFGRVQRLLEKNLASNQDLDNAEAAMKVAKANYEAAATRLGYARICAPFKGTITKRFLDPGALVAANNATLFMLMNLDSVKIIVEIPEKDVPLISKVRSARISLDAIPERDFTGRITRSSDAIDLATRTMEVQIEFANLDHKVKPGMFASVEMTVDEHQNAVTIPTNAILKDDVGQFVYALDGKNAKRIRIQAGTELVERTEILAGLTGEESIITVGQQFVKDGGPVTVQR
jgi:RND family efflux transporter MFP subunit